PLFQVVVSQPRDHGKAGWLSTGLSWEFLAHCASRACQLSELSILHRIQSEHRRMQNLVGISRTQMSQDGGQPTAAFRLASLTASLPQLRERSAEGRSIQSMAARVSG